MIAAVRYLRALWVHAGTAERGWREMPAGSREFEAWEDAADELHAAREAAPAWLVRVVEG